MSNIKEIKDRIKKSGEEIKKEIQEKTLGYILAAFGLVAALAWNDAIKSLIEYFFPFNQGTILIKFIYAIFITSVIVIISIHLRNLLSKEDNKENK